MRRVPFSARIHACLSNVFSAIPVEIFDIVVVAAIVDDDNDDDDDDDDEALAEK